MPQWRSLLALVCISAGYGAAYYLLGGAEPDHQQLVKQALSEHVLRMAQGLLRS